VKILCLIFITNNITDYVVACPTFVYINGTYGNDMYYPTFPGPSCPTNVPYNQNCSTNTTYGVIPTSTFVCRNVQVPISSCRGSGCISPNSSAIATLITKGVNGLTGYTDLINNHIDPLLSCKIITDTFSSLQDELCVSLVTALFMIVLSSGFLGTLFCCGIITSILAIKRFNPENRQLWEVND